MPRTRPAALLAAFVAVTVLTTVPACAGRSASESATSPRGDPRRLSFTEITEAMTANVSNLYDLVRSRRMEWLRPTVVGLRTATPMVWMDRMRLGSLDTMRNVPLASVESVRYLTPSEAQGELGLDNMGGAIVISTRSQP